MIESTPDIIASVIASVGIAGFLFGIIIFLLWMLLPLALYGIKGRLDRIHAEARLTNSRLKQLIDAIDSKKNQP